MPRLYVADRVTGEPVEIEVYTGGLFFVNGLAARVDAEGMLTTLEAPLYRIPVAEVARLVGEDAGRN